MIYAFSFTLFTIPSPNLLAEPFPFAHKVCILWIASLLSRNKSNQKFWSKTWRAPCETDHHSCIWGSFSPGSRRCNKLEHGEEGFSDSDWFPCFLFTTSTSIEQPPLLTAVQKNKIAPSLVRFPILSYPILSYLSHRPQFAPFISDKQVQLSVKSLSVKSLMCYGEKFDC